MTNKTSYLENSIGRIQAYIDFYNQSFDKGWINYSFYKSNYEFHTPNEDTNYELKCK